MLKNITLLSGALATGIVTGLLLSPKSGRENRKLLSKYLQDTARWIELNGRETLEQSGKTIDEFIRVLQSNVDNSFPDLYDATESLYLTDEDLVINAR